MRFFLSLSFLKHTKYTLRSHGKFMRMLSLDLEGFSFLFWSNVIALGWRTIPLPWKYRLLLLSPLCYQYTLCHLPQIQSSFTSKSDFFIFLATVMESKVGIAFIVGKKVR